MRDLFKLAGLRILFLPFLLLQVVECLTIPISGSQQMGQRNLKMSNHPKTSFPLAELPSSAELCRGLPEKRWGKKGNAAETPALKGVNWNFGHVRGHTLIGALKKLGLCQNGSMELWVFHPR